VGLSSHTAAGTTTRAPATTCSRASDSSWAPWYVARSDDKKKLRLNVIKHLLSQTPYERTLRDKIKLQEPGDYREPAYPYKYVPETY
jgi:polyphosphate kinase